MLKKAIWLFIFVLCLALVLAPGCGGGTDYSATIKQVTELVEQGMRENEVTGLSIALVDGQDVVWMRGFGYADKEHSIKASTEIIYEIGSISKPITATAVMHAQDNGLLDIEHPLIEYLPEFSILPPLGYDRQPDNPITIRMMLTHHSGIPGNFLNGNLTLKPRTDYDAWLLNYLRSDNACYPPNFIWAYSNSAYCFLADVVAAASDQSWEEYTDMMFESMGMHHTSYYFHKPFLKENRARGYFNGEPLEHFYNSHVGAGSVLSNASEMAKYIKMILGHGQGEGSRVLRPETLDEMLTPQDLGIALDAFKWNRQGLGWGLSDPELEYAGRVCGHDGATIGFCSHLQILLEHQLGVVILTNSDQRNAMGFVVEVGRETLRLALKDKAGIDPVEPSGPTHSPPVTWPQDKLEALAGVYVTEAGYDIINDMPGELEWATDGGMSQKLVPLENGRLALPDSQDFQIEFTTISRRDVMVLHSVYTNVRGDRYEPVPVPTSWHNRLGKYEITNLYPGDSSMFVPEELSLVPDSIDLAERDGMLVIKYPVQGGTIWLVLEPLGDTVALIRGLGEGKGGAVQIVMVDGQEQLQLWGSLYMRQ